MTSIDPSTFNRKTTGVEVCQTISDFIKGKRIILTGPSLEGIGYSTAEAIAQFDPAEIILAGRTISKLKQGQEKLLKVAPNVKVTLLELDTSSLASVRKAAKEINDRGVPIDVLINNAAVMDTPFTYTAEGFELQLVTNHLGHFLFTTLILDLILASDNKRIVQVSSMGHAYGNVRWEDPNFTEKDSYTPNAGYGQSKAAMTLFARALANKYGSQGLKAFSLHPGGISTPLQKHWTDEYKQMIKENYGAWHEDGSLNMDIWKTLEQGASTTCRAAFDPNLEPNGAYLDDCQIAEGKCSEFAKDPANVDKIWAWSEKLIAEAK